MVEESSMSEREIQTDILEEMRDILNEMNERERRNQTRMDEMYEMYKQMSRQYNDNYRRNNDPLGIGIGMDKITQMSALNGLFKK